MFAEQLKNDTAEAHMALERKMIPYLKKISSKAEYIRLLAFLHRYYTPLEEKLDPWTATYNWHSHAKNIEKDLRNLEPGFGITGAPATDLPAIDSAEKALGVLYVLEGSTMGGQVITKMIGKQTGLEGDYFNYYNPYGDETMEKWKGFKEYLSGPFTEDQQKDIADGANETFSTLHKWILTYESDNQ